MQNKNNSPMTRTQIYIPSDLLQAKITAKSQGFNLSQYLRDLILEKENSLSNKPKNKLLKDMKSISIGGPTVYYSRDHNDIYDY